MSPIRVLIVDDGIQVRQDLHTVLTLAGGIQIVGEAVNGVEAVYKAAALHPDVVLMDLEMPVMDGYTATAQIKQSNSVCRIIALTVHDYDEARTKAIQAGVDALIVKGSPMDTLINEIVTAAPNKE